MPWVLLGGHVVAIAVLVVLSGRSTIRPLLAVAAIAPAVTAVWAIVRLAQDVDAQVVEISWVDGLDLGLRFRTDALALMMTLLVSGIGALIFVYAIGYFAADAAGGGRFAASLLGFSTSMLGLVWSDSVWTLFIFWELTSVTSFLLVGHKNTDASVRAAARRALLITGGGGLALLAGLLVLADNAGTTVITDLTPVSGTGGSVAAALILIGAATKSAQLPFHVWLPGAMAAPTPVSAYLHSATMVKAGVFLLAVTGGAFTEVGLFTPLGMAFGLGSMIWGAVGALRHRDAKLILAWGTVSQLGLMVTLLAIGSAKAIFAAVSILFAHALFKAALFVIVGEIDIRTGTRDITELGGLARTMPITFAVAVAAGLSMAGAPPLLGFAAKESAVEAVLKLSGWEQIVATAGVVGGSVLTVAYTVRFLIGVFGPGPSVAVAPARPAMTIPAVLLGGAGLVGFGTLGIVNDIVRPAAIELDPKADVYSLLRWPGFTAAFGISAGILAGGLVLGMALSRRVPRVPSPIGADSTDRMLDETLHIARRVTARVQHGSLPVYVAVMAAAASLATLPFLTNLDDAELIWANSALEALLAIAIAAAALFGAFVGSRLGAALTLGAVGTGVSGLFVLHGAPDLALTQLLVETIVVVGFVIGLGHLAREFPAVTGGWRTARLLVSGLAGTSVAVGLAAASSRPSGRAPVDEITSQAVDEGGGNNVVNVILTDMRALDTLGEVVVLATVVLGILALARLRDPEGSS